MFWPLKFFKTSKQNKETNTLFPGIIDAIRAQKTSSEFENSLRLEKIISSKSPSKQKPQKKVNNDLHTIAFTQFNCEVEIKTISLFGHHKIKDEHLSDLMQKVNTLLFEIVVENELDFGKLEIRYYYADLVNASNLEKWKQYEYLVTRQRGDELQIFIEKIGATEQPDKATHQHFAKLRRQIKKQKKPTYVNKVLSVEETK